MVKTEKCPLCNGSGENELKAGHMKGHIVNCWRCKSTGKIPKVEILSGMLFESMIQDSINIRQKLLYNETEEDLIEAGERQIKCFEDSINNPNEEDYMIEEYNYHLTNFIEWFEIFKKDIQFYQSNKRS